MERGVKMDKSEPVNTNSGSRFKGASTLMSHKKAGQPFGRALACPMGCGSCCGVGRKYSARPFY